MARNAKVEFAVYKGDEYIMIGTYEEIAKELGLTMYTTRFYATQTHKKRSPNGIHLIKLDDEEVDNSK